MECAEAQQKGREFLTRYSLEDWPAKLPALRGKWWEGEDDIEIENDEREAKGIHRQSSWMTAGSLGFFRAIEKKVKELSQAGINPQETTFLQQLTQAATEEIVKDYPRLELRNYVCLQCKHPVC